MVINYLDSPILNLRMSLDSDSVTLTVVLAQTMGTLEEPVTCGAVVVFVQAVFFEVILVVKVGLTFATIVMSGTLDVVLFESQPRIKVPITVVTNVVSGRVCDVLLVRGPGLEVACAAIAVGHQERTFCGKEQLPSGPLLINGIRGPTRVCRGHVTPLYRIYTYGLPHLRRCTPPPHPELTDERQQEGLFQTVASSVDLGINEIHNTIQRKLLSVHSTKRY
ncbi:hypothetical protein OG21DRAFT_1099947 [Imleria badia]|nr:hypothetical protein OG21DRAFT_1099947 [Imleria badia]